MIFIRADWDFEFNLLTPTRKVFRKKKKKKEKYSMRFGCSIVLGISIIRDGDWL
jgi:hypothetical protein